jgi:hypothetical protein
VRFPVKPSTPAGFSFGSPRSGARGNEEWTGDVHNRDGASLASFSLAVREEIPGRTATNGRPGLNLALQTHGIHLMHFILAPVVSWEVQSHFPLDGHWS